MPIPKWLQRLSNATIKASIAENPAVATASGWTIDNSGEARQNATEEPGVKQLQESLATIATIPLTDVASEAVAVIPAVQKSLTALQGLTKNWKAAKASKNPLKWVWNNGKVVQETIPESVINSKSWYRIVDDSVKKGAIKDAQTSGIIRTNEASIFKSPMFRKGEPYWPLNGSKFNNTKSAIIVSKPNSQLEWKAVDNMGELLDPNSQRVRDALGRTPTMEELIHINNSVGTPTVNGATSVAPANEFTFWRKYPKLGWRELSFKSGGKIHIKKENRGKFTDYCGGKVTEACIQRGKHSSNPTTRKRATFAANSRRWKHQEGGYITPLNDADENWFRNWYSQYSLVTGNHPNPDAPEHHYDLRGFWAANRYSTPIPGMHLPDTWKTPGHETFSIESKYYKPGMKAGYWDGEQFIQLPATINLDDIKLRQRYAESSFRNNTSSSAGSKGAFGIMPIVLHEYTTRTGKTGDLFDPVFNEQVRDWYFDKRLPEFKVINADSSNPQVQMAKKLAAYNWGPGFLGNYLSKRKEEGVDIYNTLDWVDGLPKETRDYVKFILLNEDVSAERNNKSYQDSLARFRAKYQQGGLIYKPFMLNNPESTQKQDEQIEYKYSDIPVTPVQGFQFQELQYRTKPRRGTTVYKDSIDAGNMKELLDKFEEAGISVRVTSGYREKAKTKQGNTSRHSTGDAIDITPIEGQSYEDLRQQIANSPELLAYMRDNNIGIIDETDPRIKAATGATGDHWHISKGGEQLAISGFKQLFG